MILNIWGLIGTEFKCRETPFWEEENENEMYKSSLKYITVVKGWTIIKSVAQQFVRGSLFHVLLVGSFEYVPHWVIEKGKKKNQSNITASGEMWFESLRNEYIFLSNYEKSFKKKRVTVLTISNTYYLQCSPSYLLMAHRKSDFISINRYGTSPRGSSPIVG